MSFLQSLRAWIVLSLLRVAFTVPSHRYAQQIIRLLQFLFFKAESHWTAKTPHGTLISEDVGNAKMEALIDRLLASDVVILWIPGGGFRMNLGTLYVPTFKTWIRALAADKNITANVLVVDYRTNTSYPGPVEEAVKAYGWLVNQIHVSPNKIILGGDDAGVGIALDALQKKSIKVAGLVCMSPYTGLEAGGASWRANDQYDYIRAAAIDRMEQTYIPAEGDQPFEYLTQDIPWTFLPSSMLVMVGGREVLLDEAGMLAARARSNGVDVTLYQAPLEIHLWSMLGLPVIHDPKIYQASTDILVHFLSGCVAVSNTRR
ncbi:Alpha/Beta hydrolase protein [Radiomyces spectabilis]|uniref:Alpha/Beta hydrolase protein n=1 Tax=Radiomyces spectabilis TaxID=64574 RepID=UPI002220144D|nr:Alpha/Beta hydrolase protein [Radiomyces spectabilis]KAI8368150.1 Alpha/Beta hydrolase protein [Radiomyces spectabilis]